MTKRWLIPALGLALAVGFFFGGAGGIAPGGGQRKRMGDDQGGEGGYGVQHRPPVRDRCGDRLPHEPVGSPSFIRAGAFSGSRPKAERKTGRKGESRPALLPITTDGIWEISP